MKIKNWLPFLILPAVFIAVLGVQTHMKLMPQLVLLLYAAVTIIASLLKQEKLTSALIGSLILFCSFLLWYLISNSIVYSISPKVKTEHYVSDHKWLISLAIAIVLSIGTTFLYFRK